MVGPANPVGEMLGRYEVMDCLVRGDMAELLLARAAGQHVVIKRMRADAGPASAELFVCEARLAQTLVHPNLGKVIDVGQLHDVPYLVAEYIHGEDLRHLLTRAFERNVKVPVEHVVAIVRAAAAGLHHVHEQKGSDDQPLGIVHRGVSPTNILLGYDGTVKLVDVGIVRAMPSSARSGLRDKAPYMSPEQCTGKKLDRRSDLFSLGTVFYELLTGRRLFKASSEYLTMAAVVGGKVPPPSAQRKDIPRALEEVARRTLAVDPAARIQTAQELVDAIDGLGLVGSPAKLASYMTEMFGERPMPWSAPGTVPSPVHVDFDGKGTGLAVPPPEALKAMPNTRGAATKASPIEAARAQLAVPAPVAATPSAPVVIPGGGPAAAAAPGPRKKSNTRAPIPAPTRQRPKTIQIPTTKLEPAKQTTRQVDSGWGDATPEPSAADGPMDSSPLIAPPVATAKTATTAKADPTPIPSVLPAKARITPTAFAAVSTKPLAQAPPSALPVGSSAPAAKPVGRPTTVPQQLPIVVAAAAVQQDPELPAVSGELVATPAAAPVFVGAVETVESPLAIVETEQRRDNTDVVIPLPAPRVSTVQPVDPGLAMQPEAQRRRWLPFAFGGAVILALILVLAIGLSGGGSDEALAQPASIEPARVAPTRVEPTPAAEPGRTWASSQPRAPVEPTPVAVEPVAVEPVAVKPPVVAKPAIKKPINIARPARKPPQPPTTVASRPAVKPVVKPVVKKPVTKPVKTPPAKQGAWDPDSLFPKR